VSADTEPKCGQDRMSFRHVSYCIG
jgi:hypothetical protein